MACAWLRSGMPDGLLRSGLVRVPAGIQQVSIWSWPCSQLKPATGKTRQPLG